MTFFQWRIVASIPLVWTALLLAPLELARRSGPSPCVWQVQCRRNHFLVECTFFFQTREREPRLVFRFVHSEPIIAKDVVDWKPGEILTFSRSELGDILKFPSDLANMELAGYRPGRREVKHARTRDRGGRGQRL